MKTKAVTFLAGLALVTAARAGTPEVAAPPVPSAGLWEWFIGGSAGYLTNLNEGMYGLQVGMDYKSPEIRGIQSIYLEVAFTQDYENYAFDSRLPGGISERASIDLNIIPITLNYKYEAPITERLNWYAGLGLGVAVLDSSYDWSWSQALPPPNDSGGGSDDETEVRFYGHVFAGLTYEINDFFEIFAGARYIFMDDVDRDIDVTGASDYTAGINGDVLVEVGAWYHF